MTARVVVASGMHTNAAILDTCAYAYPLEITIADLAGPAAAASNTAGAEGVIVLTNPLPRSVIEAFADSVKIIGRAGVGLDAIDLEAAKERGIAVYHTPDYCVPEVATHTVAMILALNRRLFLADHVARSDWSNWRTLAPLPALSEQVVGLIGFGRIGKAVAALLRPLVASVLAYDPHIAVDAPGIQPVDSLEELLTTSDYISLHLPLTAETVHLLGRAQLASMRPGAALVNVSRAGLVDEEALVAALEGGHLSGAALDVLPGEPPSERSAILRAPNLVLTPHVAWYSVESERRLWEMTLTGMTAYFAGNEPPVGRLVPLGQASTSSPRPLTDDHI